MTQPIRFTIRGQCVSSKNRQIQTVKNGRPLVFKNPDLERFKRDFLKQVPPEAKKLMSCRVAVTVIAYYASDLPDLEVEAIYDLLQEPRQIGKHFRRGAGVIVNDRQIVVKHSEKYIDPADPRIEITVEPIQWDRTRQQPGLLDDEIVRPEVGTAV